MPNVRPGRPHSSISDAPFVLFPPLTKPVLEDVASGLMAAAIRRVVGEAPSTPVMPALSEESVLDLADEEADA